MADTARDFGSRLREVRESRGISLGQIASATKISKAALEALERNEPANLPGGIFTRSFVRSYASEVGLDPEETMREFLAQFPIEGVADGSPYVNEAHEHDVFHSHQRMARTVLGLVLLSLPVIVFVVFLGLRGETDAPAAEPVAPVEAVTSADVAESSVAPPPASAPAPTVAAAVGPLTIDIHPRADCWVSLTVDGERVFSRVMRSGEREVLEAQQEIIVNVGDAGAFAFAINQRPGRSLGTEGEVVTARINRGNYRSFVTQ